MKVSKLWSLEKLMIQKFFAPKLKEKTNFFRLLALAQRSWLWLRDALISIKKSGKDKGMIMIIEHLIDQLTQWYTLSKAMINHAYFFTHIDYDITTSIGISILFFSQLI